MIRALLVTAAVCLTTLTALGADGKADSAVATFKSVGSDAGNLKILGPDFETAWNAGESIDENSPDCEKLNAALDELANKCTG